MELLNDQVIIILVKILLAIVIISYVINIIKSIKS
jgi:hypothetical protein